MRLNDIWRWLVEEQTPAVMGLTGDDDVLALAEQRLRGGYQAAGGPFGFWEVLVPMLIKVGFDLLVKCLQDRAAADVQQAGRQRDRRAKLAAAAFVRRELRERYGFGAWFTHNGDACVAALLDAAAASTPE